MQQSQNAVDTIVELIKGKVMDAALNNSDAIAGNRFVYAKNICDTCSTASA